VSAIFWARKKPRLPYTLNRIHDVEPAGPTLNAGRDNTKGSGWAC
jgi:hypothetical protein